MGRRKKTDAEVVVNEVAADAPADPPAEQIPEWRLPMDPMKDPGCGFGRVEPEAMPAAPAPVEETPEPVVESAPAESAETEQPIAGNKEP